MRFISPAFSQTPLLHLIQWTTNCFHSIQISLSVPLCRPQSALASYKSSCQLCDFSAILMQLSFLATSSLIELSLQTLHLMFQVFSWQPQASSHWWFGKPGENKLFTFLLFGLSHLFNPSVKFCGRVNMSRPNLAKSLKVLLIISIVYHLIFILLIIIIVICNSHYRRNVPLPPCQRFDSSPDQPDNTRCRL